MPIFSAQIWKGSNFSIDRMKGKSPRTVIFRLTGPFTARDMYNTLTPANMKDMFEHEVAPGEPPPNLNIFDLSGVPYMDSMGLGVLVTQYVRCQGKGVRMVATGLTPRVLEVFKLTKVSTIIPTAVSLEDADVVAP
jgi:anti-anti-sigma factor